MIKMIGAVVAFFFWALNYDFSRTLKVPIPGLHQEFANWVFVSEFVAFSMIAAAAFDRDETERLRKKGSVILLFNYILSVFFLWSSTISAWEFLLLGIAETVACLLICFSETPGPVWVGSLLLMIVSIVGVREDCDLYPERGTCVAESAVKHNFVRLMKGFERDADPFLKVQNKSLLEYTVEGGHFETTDFLINKGLEIKAKMYLTADSVSDKVLDLLLKTRKNTDVALIYAARDNRMSLAPKLIGAGANVNFPDKAGETALMIAVGKGFDALAKALLPFKPDTNTAYKNGDSVLIRAARGDHSSLAEELLKNGAKVNHRDKKGETALMIAVDKGFDALAKTILRFKPDTNIAYKNGDSVLIRAARGDRGSLAEGLLKNGAKVNHRDEEGETALMIAVDKGFDALAKTILRFKPDTNIPYQDGETVLIKTVKGEKIDLSREILSAGAQPNAADKNGNSPLFFAVRENNIDLIDLLIQKGADVKQKNHRGDIPVMETIKLETIGFLKEKGSPIPSRLGDKVLDENANAFTDEYLEIFHGD